MSVNNTQNAAAPASKQVRLEDMAEIGETFEIVENSTDGEVAEQSDPLPKSFDIQLFPNGISLTPSPIGLTAGAAAASFTYSVMNHTLNATSDVTGAAINCAGYLIERGAAYFGGEIAGTSIYLARNALAHGARTSIRFYSPMTSVIASAVVGTTTAYTVTAGGVLARAAANTVKRAYKKYREGKLITTDITIKACDEGQHETGHDSTKQ